MHPYNLGRMPDMNAAGWILLPLSSFLSWDSSPKSMTSRSSYSLQSRQRRQLLQPGRNRRPWRQGQFSCFFFDYPQELYGRCMNHNLDMPCEASLTFLHSGHELRLGICPFQFALRVSLLVLVCLCVGFAIFTPFLINLSKFQALNPLQSNCNCTY